jgi:hypothetical protein
VISPILNEAFASSTQRDKERKLAAAELRRQAKAARRADGSSASAARVVAAMVPLIPAIDAVAGAWRSLGRGLVSVVGQRATA